MRKNISTLAALATVMVSAHAASLTQPSPRLSPRDVVKLQLDALKAVDQPVKDAGFATVFRFTSPGNRAQTGPLPRFAQMIRQGFGEMINFKSAALLPTVQEADQALQPVEVTSLAGRKYRYVFVLRRQDDGNCIGCWLTDGVIPQDQGKQSSQDL